jgi:cytochrome c oxidase subunit 1
LAHTLDGARFAERRADRGGSSRPAPLWAERESLPIVTGVSVNRREIRITTLADARPEIREASPDSSIWPLIAAIATTVAFIASIFSPWAAVWGSALIGLTLIGWFWPKKLREDFE